MARTPLLALALAAAACGSEPPPALLLVTVDTLRADHVGSYGYARDTTPRLDALAGEGVRFEGAIVPRGQTWPSLVSLLTAVLPSEHGVVQNGWPTEGIPTPLAETLAERGWPSAAFLTNMKSAGRLGFEEVRAFDGDEADARATAAAGDWLLRADPERPFFAWLHLLGPHSPYAPSEPFRARFAAEPVADLDGSHATLSALRQAPEPLGADAIAYLVSLYDADVAEADARLGELLDALNASGRAEHTLVVVSSDHGEELYQHHRYFMHSLSIYDAVLHVPLVLRWPGRLPRGAVVKGIASTLGVAPTLLELLGIEAPQGYRGRSLLGRIQGAAAGPPTPDAEVALSELGLRPVLSLRSGRWHYLRNEAPGEPPDRLFPIRREELYDLSADPHEQRDLAAERPGQLERLRAALSELRGEATPERAPAPPLPPDVQEELRALGYLE